MPHAGHAPANPEKIDLAYAAAQCVVETHRRVAAFLRPGQTLPQIDDFVEKTLADLGCRSCFYLYAPDRRHVPFPSHACLSVNECVVHGTRGYYTKPLALGDVLKVDIGVFHKGWVGDAAWTYSIGTPSPQVRRLMDCGKESLRRGVATLHPKNQWIAWARAVQGHVEGECGFHLIRGLGGHGIGYKQLHGPPFVSNTVPTSPNEWREAFEYCPVGTLVAVEPMIAVGTGQTRVAMVDKKRHDWPVLTADGSMSVHYEHDVLITPDGPRVLTEGLEQVPDVIHA
jgi:methionyl aminopeptidase